jgi:serpin B
MKKLMKCALVFALVFAACGGGDTINDPVIRDLNQTEQKLVESSNLFGFSLMKEVVARSDGGNVFISPLSVSFALGMTYNGARGTTEEGMRVALQYGDLTAEEINQSYRDLIDILTALDPKVTMEIANSIWIREGFEALQAFIDVNRTFFDAVVQALDFADPGAADVINAWVDEKTHGKITEIVEAPISPVTVMFLINAIYFKGTWTYQFDPEDTSDGTFHAPEGDQAVKMMHLHGELSYQENADFQAVNLPYGDGLFSMTLLLPKPGKDLDELIGALSGENWSAWLAAFYPQEGYLYLPRFELEYETSLNDVLAALGMEMAFTGSADFTGINPGGGLFISNVKHKTYVKVNEEGTEAAAVTSVEIGYESEPQTFHLQVDRPFLFVIHDAHSSALLFMGKIVNPPSE